MHRKKLSYAGLIACFLLCTESCRRREPGKAPPEVRAQRAAPFQPSWPMHRGSPTLRGIARGSLQQGLKPAWRYQTDSAVTAPASIEGGTVYVGNENGVLYALDLRGGDLKWSYQAEGRIGGAPLVLQGVVYFGTDDGFLYAVRQGKLLWRFEADDKIPSGPNWSSVPRGVVILAGSYDNNLYCLNAADGKEVWRYESGYYINSTPAVLDGVAVFGGCDAYVHEVDLTRGTRRAAFNCGAYIGASVAVVEWKAYVGNFEGYFFCMDLRKLPRGGDSQKPGKGGKTSRSQGLLWRIRPTEEPILSSAAVGEIEVVFGSDDGRVWCARREDGRVLWSFLTGGAVRSSPVIVGSEVVVGSEDGNLYVLSLKSGKKLWSYPVGSALKAGPAVGAGFVVIGAEDGCVYAFSCRSGEGGN